MERNSLSKIVVPFAPENFIWRIIPVLIIGLLIDYFQVRFSDHIFLFTRVFLFFLGFIGLLIFFWTIGKDLKMYRDSKLFLNLLPSITGLCLLLVLFGTTYYLSRRDQSPTLFYFSKYEDFNGSSIDFRKDGTYKFGNYCLGEDYERGTYTMHDSLIELDRSNIAGVIVSQHLLIRPFNGSQNIPTSLYQLDDTGFPLKQTFVFSLLQDSLRVR
jgi:hypothetical protein